MRSTDSGVCRKVLVIDDNDDAAQMLAMFIHALGHEVLVANDGLRGLEVATCFSPEVVFLDLGMPGMSGFEVAPRLRRIAGLDAVFIVALTGWNDAKTREQVIACGFDRHLTKPAAVEEILSLVEASPKR